MAHLKQAVQPARLGKRVGIWVIGHSIKEFIDQAFDLGVTGVVAVWASSQFEPTLAVLVTFATMYVINGVACLGMLALYDWFKIDLLGIETVKSARDEETSNAPRLIRWMVRRSDFVVFLGLSLWEDAGVTTAYMRKGASKFNGLGRRDWLIFLSSNAVATAAWTGLTSAAVHTARSMLPAAINSYIDSAMEMVTQVILQAVHSIL